MNLVADFIAALCDPEGGVALHRLHASDSIVRHSEGIGRAADISEAGFATIHREVSRQWSDALPDFSRVTLLSSPVGPDVAESVIWFQVTELRGQLTMIGAMGVVAAGDMPRVGWCTLAPGVKDWSYGDGLLQSLADYPWLRRGSPSPSRALFDASYFRYHWRPPVTFTSLPDARFSCQMSTVCCRHDFEIALPAEAQLIIDAMPWERIRPGLAGTRLPVRADGKLLLKSMNETCRFLGAHRQCLIHQTLGRQPFGACAIFPFSFARVPDGIAVAMSPICGATRRNIGISPLDRYDDLRERLVHSEPRHTDAYRLAPGVEVSWEQFRDIEKALCDCLAADGVGLRRRLLVGCRLLGALRRNEPLDINTWLTQPPVEISAELRGVIRDMLGKILGWDRAALRALPREVPADLFGREARDSEALARVLQNVLFAKVYSYSFDLTTAHNFQIVLYLLALVMEDASPGGLTDVMWQELGSLGVHGLLKSVLHEGVPDGFRALFGTGEFGEWALAA